MQSRRQRTVGAAGDRLGVEQFGAASGELVLNVRPINILALPPGLRAHTLTGFSEGFVRVEMGCS